jgi:hypothetical protein
MYSSAQKLDNDQLPSGKDFGKFFKIILALLLVLLLVIGSIMPAFSRGYNSIKINVPSRTLQLMQGNRVIREYPVGVGLSKNMMTPAGTYKVEKKVIDPVWEHPYKPEGQVRIADGQKNPLGPRWIGFHHSGSGVYGIHGTNDPSSVGRFVSHGCVRMYNKDIEEIFDLVDIGSPVIVTYERFKLSVVGDKVLMEVFPDPYSQKPLFEDDVINSILRMDQTALIDREMIKSGIKDLSEKNIYEVAILNQSSFYGQPNPQAFPMINNNYLPPQIPHPEINYQMPVPFFQYNDSMPIYR